MASSIVLVILVTSFATYLSRFLGVVSSESIKETSKLFRWFNCLAYSTLAALIARTIIFPAGALMETGYFIRFVIILVSLIIFFLSKRNLVYPTVFSAIILSLLNSFYFFNYIFYKQKKPSLSNSFFSYLFSTIKQFFLDILFFNLDFL